MPPASDASATTVEATGGSLLLAAFAREQPAAFAFRIAGAGVEELARIVERLPADAVAPVLRRLPGALLEELFSRIPDSLAARWVGEAGEGEAASLYRRLTPGRRQAVRSALPDTGRRRALDRAASFPPGCVGALADRDFAWLASDAAIGEAAKRLAAWPGGPSSRVLVLDGEDRVVGRFDAARAMAQDPRVRIAECVIRVPGLDARTCAEAAIESAGWEEHGWLPVVDRQGRVVGVASRQNLLAARAPARPAGFAPGAAALPLHLLSAYGRVLAGWAALARREEDRP